MIDKTTAKVASNESKLHQVSPQDGGKKIVGGLETEQNGKFGVPDLEVQQLPENLEAETSVHNHMLEDFFLIEEYVQNSISKALHITEEDKSRCCCFKHIVRIFLLGSVVISLPILIIVLLVTCIVFPFWLLYIYLRRPRLPDWMAQTRPIAKIVLRLGLTGTMKVEEHEDDPVIDTTECAAHYNIETKNELGWEGYPMNFDCGIYWFSFNSKCSKGLNSKYFDPKKKTVLYIHGWACGSTIRGYRELINWPTTNSKTKKRFKLDEANPVDLWIKEGYNVGIFYWNQYSDELLVVDAEKKIFNSSDMRWTKQNPDGSVSHVVSPKHKLMSVSEILEELYVAHFTACEDPQPIRLVGHSIGTQLSLELIRRLIVNPKCHRYPQRLTLLDPYFSKQPRHYHPLNGMKAEQRAAETVNLIRDSCPKMAIETYQTSLCCYSTHTLGGYCSRFKNQTVYTKVNLKLYNWYNVSERHMTTPHFYFCAIKLDGWKSSFFNPSVSYEDLMNRMPNVYSKLQPNESSDSITCEGSTNDNDLIEKEDVSITVE